MKKSSKILLITACIFIFLGICLTAVSFSMADGDIFTYKINRNYVKKELTYDTQKISSFTYTGRSHDIIVKPSSDDKFHVTYYESDHDKYEIKEIYYVLNGEKAAKLSISHEPEQTKNDLFNMQITLNSDVHKIIVEIPKTLDSVSIETRSGDIDINGISLTGDMLLKSASGDHTLQKVSVGTFTSNTSSGDVTLSAVTVNGKTAMETSSGDLTITEFTANDHMAAKTSSGDITMKAMRLVYADIESSSGDVILDIAPGGKARYISRQTVSGTVHIGSPDWFSENDTTDKDTSEYPSPEEMKKLTITIHTSSGDITID